MNTHVLETFMLEVAHTVNAPSESGLHALTFGNPLQNHALAAMTPVKTDVKHPALMVLRLRSNLDSCNATGQEGMSLN